jgi:hypothetical protein
MGAQNETPLPRRGAHARHGSLIRSSRRPLLYTTASFSKLTFANGKARTSVIEIAAALCDRAYAWSNGEILQGWIG